MSSSGMLRRVALVRTDVSEERRASLISVTTAFVRSLLRLLVIVKVVPSSPIFFPLMMEALRSSETSVLTRATRRSIPEDGNIPTLFADSLIYSDDEFGDCEQGIWKDEKGKCSISLSNCLSVLARKNYGNP
jgi:hypothetical protein